MNGDPQRILIIGNGGTGKTWLSRKMGARLGLPVTHLDDVRWQPGHYGLARDNAEVIEDTRRLSEADRWLVEGVYGWLARVLLPRTELLVWLDVPEAECLANIRVRGNQGGAKEESFVELLEWVATYRTRGGSSCYQAYMNLYDGFEGRKYRLPDRTSIGAFLDQITATDQLT
jgi:adenylate kinase family enzyme